jgi:hypothetical protein
MVAPPAELSRSLHSLPLAALGDSPAVRRDAPRKSRREGAAVGAFDGAAERPPRRLAKPRIGPRGGRAIERALDYVDDVQDPVNILAAPGVDEPHSLTSLTRQSGVNLTRSTLSVPVMLSTRQRPAFPLPSAKSVNEVCTLPFAW